MTDHSVYLKGALPEQSAGRPWGDEVVTIDSAGGPYRFTGLSAGQAKLVREKFAAIITDAPARVEVAVRRDEALEFVQREWSGFYYEIAMTYEPGSVHVSGIGFTGRVDFEGSESTDPHGTFFTCWDDHGHFLGAFENAFRVLTGYRLALDGGVLVHSAGVVPKGDDDAYVFFGPSDAGKTTAATLSESVGHRVLSDELNALYRDGDLTRVSQIPFAGEMGCEVTVCTQHPLAGLFRLVQADSLKSADASSAVSPRREPLRTSAAMACLLGACPFLNADPYRGELLFENVANLVSSYPVERLVFQKDPSFWSVLRPDVTDSRGARVTVGSTDAAR